MRVIATQGRGCGDDGAPGLALPVVAALPERDGAGQADKRGSLALASEALMKLRLF